MIVRFSRDLSVTGSHTVPTNSTTASSDTQNGSADIGLIVIFDVLYIFGFISLSVVLLTAWLSSRIHRTSLWFLFISSWLFSSVSNLFLLGQQTDPKPSFGLCMLQASMVYAAPIINSTSALSFMIHVYLSIRHGNPIANIPRLCLILLHVFPFVATVVTFCEVIAVGMLDRHSVVPDTSGMYCHISSQVPNRITSSLTVTCMIAVLIVDLMIIRILRRMWREIQRAARPLELQTEEHISLDSIMRVVIFAFLPMIALVVSCSQYFPDSQEKETSARTNIVVAALPAAAFFIFGSQKDMLRAWGIISKPKDIHWRRKGVSSSDEAQE